MTGQWFSLDPPVSSTNKTDRHDISEILKMALNTIKQTTLTTNNRSGRGVQHYVIKCASGLRQVGGFLLFPPPIKLTATI